MPDGKPESWEAFLERLLAELNRLYARGIKSDLTILLRPMASGRANELPYWFDVRLHNPGAPSESPRHLSG